MVHNSFADLCVPNVRRSVEFYRRLLGLDVLVDHGWYAELGHAGTVHVALVQAGHETVPADTPVLVSFEVEDATAVAGALPVTRELGQCHFMTSDPDGTIVDVIERIPLTAEDRRRMVRYRRELRGPSC